MARNRYMVGLVFLTFFVMSLLTNILGPIVPDIISSFHVSLTAAGFLAREGVSQLLRRNEAVANELFAESNRGFNGQFHHVIKS